MNSISYLDSILTRSLTSSRSASGTSTPVGGRSDARPGGTERRASESGTTGLLNRRASDYSLSREREREKRRLAASLGLTSLDSADNVQQYERRRSSKRSSRKSSRSGSARHSESEQDPSSASYSENVGGQFDDVEDDQRSAAPSRHPKSYSEGYDEAELQRQRLRRAGSSPAPVRITSSQGWGGLWGFSGFLEEASGTAGGYEAKNPYLRRSSTNFGGRSNRLQPSGSLQSDGRRRGTAFASSGIAGRRASTGDADAALIGFAPDALLSEREREDVVDLEGYDPDYDVNPLPQAPPSTPFPTTMQLQGVSPSGSANSLSGKESASASDRLQSGQVSTTSRLSSLLFGALNPLTDDYFGPQPFSARGSPGAGGRRRASEASEKKRRADRARRNSQASKDSHSGSSSSGHGREGSTEKVEAQKQADDASAPASSVSDVPSSEPPPPYSDEPNKEFSSSSTSAKSLLLPSPSLSPASTFDAGRTSSRRTARLSASLLRGAKTTIDFLRRLILAILLAPYRLFQHGRRQRKLRAVEVAVGHDAQTTAEPQSRSKLAGSAKMFQTLSQAERPSASRHLARQRKGDEIEEERTPLLDGVKSSDSDSEDGKAEEEAVTEDQAEARAIRRARKDALLARKEQQNEQDDKRIRASSRLLPNPNPVDPLLAHDRDAKAPLPQHDQNRQRIPGPVALVNRGPMSSLIHHSPKVLVLDLDETLIHSTSRSPMWSALADKSKTRLAVTTGGSLLGLEGLGGVLGLRGQVGVRPHQVEVVLDGRSIIYHVYKRPHVDAFLRKVASWYHVVVFTASVQEYADPVIDWLDQGRGLISARLFRESCTYRNGSYYKNLAMVDSDLSRVCLVDNSPASYMINQANGIPIEGWTHDPNDEALLDLLPVLDSLRFASDVRHILGIRGFSDPMCRPAPTQSS